MQDIKKHRILKSTGYCDRRECIDTNSEKIVNKRLRRPVNATVFETPLGFYP